MSSDPFGLAALRDSTLTSWRSSPTRRIEDCATEHDLASIGYRDRLVVELAANAADAATAANIEGRLGGWLDGRALVIANTGAGLTVDGVRSLLAVRVSAKERDGSVVGRFGVGFSAVAAVADRVEIRSVTGSLVFDRALSAQAADTDDVPLLRLAWPTDNAPPAGFDTAVVVHPRPDVDAAELLATMTSSVPDLLVELPALQQISVAERTVVRRCVDRGPDVAELILDADDGSSRHWLQARGSDGPTSTRWLVELVDGIPRPYRRDMLRAPTETDIELSLPARCITTIAVTPDRRQLYPGVDIATAAAGYAELVRAVPSAHRPLLVPRAGFARNEIDAALRDAVRDRLRVEAWVPRAAYDDGEAATVAGARALVFADLSTQLGDVIGPVIADVVAADVSQRADLAVLRSVGATELSLAGLVAQLAQVQQSPEWWQRLYDALAPYVGGGHDVEELGALPIPRADGRLNFGARGLWLAAPGVGPIGWLPTVHPDAVHSLLERLGAQRVSVSELLDADTLAAIVSDLDDSDPDDPDVDARADDLADEVLQLIAGHPDADVPARLAGLLIRADDGELARADELLLPDSPLTGVLVDDSPFGLVADAVIERFGVDALRRLGVGWGFSLIHDDLPTGPDHDLPDEADWWDTLAQPPAELRAVRDLDLVAPNRWPDALTLLADDPALAVTLSDRDGYTAWWLRTFATVGGRRLAQWRAPGDEGLADLLDPLDHPRADDVAAALGGLPFTSPTTVEAVVDRLGDDRHPVRPGHTVAAYSAVAQALQSGLIEEVGDGADPVAVRALSGEVVGEQALVIDRPWLLQVVSADVAVVASVPIEPETAAIIADAFDLRLASEGLRVDVVGVGEPATWSTSSDATVFAAQRGGDLPRGEVRLHDRLTVVVDDGESRRDVPVSWWVDDRGVTHLARRAGAPPAG